jgi:hypothetical protein
MVLIGIVAFTPVGFFGFFVVLIWSVIVSILIYRRIGSAAPGAPPASAAASLNGRAHGRQAGRPRASEVVK